MKNVELLYNKIVLVTGGTGSFGSAVVKRLLQTNVKEIRIFSRDEKKQFDMAQKFSNNSKRLRFFIGDVRDKQSIVPAMRGVDFVFHASALKQVPAGELFPMEFVKTNVLGTNNVLDVAIEHNVKKVVCLSTDKASYPINAMGISKAMMERVSVAKGRENHKTIICRTRYGNVMMSRGSAIPLWLNQIENKMPITITNPDMTRFMMTLDDAVDLVMYAFENAKQGDLFIQKSPACTVQMVVNALKKMKSINHEVKVIGIRHGEKLEETLITKEEMLKAKDLGDYYVVNDDNPINYDNYKEYNSSNTRQMKLVETITLLTKAGVMK